MMKVPAVLAVFTVAAERRAHGVEKRALESHERAARRALPEVEADARRGSRCELAVEKQPDQSRHIVAVRRAIEIGLAAPLGCHHAR